MWLIVKVAETVRRRVRVSLHFRKKKKEETNNTGLHRGNGYERDPLQMNLRKELEDQSVNQKSLKSCPLQWWYAVRG